jgi:hypothetical protein
MAKTRTRDLRRVYRRAFLSVMSAHQELRGTIGHAAAVDYSSVIDRSGPQNLVAHGSMPFVDFCVDVENVVDRTCTDAEKAAFWLHHKDGAEVAVTTEEMMELQSKIGRVFAARGIYPVREYFTTIKHGRKDMR